MNLEFFIAHRLLKGNKGSVAVPIVRIALVGIALGVCVMLLSIFVTFGFKQEITNKITGFSSHVNVVAYNHHRFYGDDNIELNDTIESNIQRIKWVKNVYPYVNRSVVLKGGSEIGGVVLYGVDTTYKWTFFEEALQEGQLPHFNTENASDEILLSVSVASALKLKVGDKVQAHFVQDPPRVRVFRIVGLYETGLKEYDEIFVICDMRHLQRINGWKMNEVTGLAITFDNLDNFEEKRSAVEYELPWEEDGTTYKIESLYEDASQVFDWLELLNMNVWIILILMVTVAGFNMVSGLLILILEKTAMIGVLKALGARNYSLRKVFLYISIGLTGRGMLWGNGLALLLAWLQWQFHIISLDPETYYMDTVPIIVNWFDILVLDAGVLFVCTLMLVVPSMLVSRIKPLKAIRFE